MIFYSPSHLRSLLLKTELASGEIHTQPEKQSPSFHYSSMAIRKLFVFSIFLSVLILKIAADSSIKDEILTSEGSDSPPKLELEQLKSKISVLGQFTCPFHLPPLCDFYNGLGFLVCISSVLCWRF